MQAGQTVLTHRADATIVATDTFVLMKVPAPAGLEGLVLDVALYRETSGAATRQVESASLTVPLIIGFGEPFKIAIGRQPTANDAYGSFTSGLSLKPVNIASVGRCSCLQINFTPLGARRFFGVTMSALTQQMIRLDELEVPSLLRLRQRLGEESDWDRRLELAEALLIERLGDGAKPSTTAEWAYHRLLGTRGMLPVERLAREVDWSRKHLAARFREEIGLPPKQVARIARFVHANALATSNAATGWADIAAACGYADQSHLAREFREFAGATPTAWLDAAER